MITLQPMDQFVKIPRKFLELKENTKFIDILVYAILDNQRDGATNTSKIGMKTISDKYNISLQKVEDSIKRLKDKEYIAVKQRPCQDTEYVYNEYSFKYLDNNFLMLKPEVLSLEYKPKERGILIYLQLIAEIGINEIYPTKIEDIADELGVTRQTASKYIKYFLKMNELTVSKFGYYTCKYLAK